jgi:prevent-host-death family protein
MKNIRPLTEFRNHIKDYIEELNTQKKPIVLTQHGKSAAVLLDPEQFQELQDQIEFMRKVSLGLEDIKQKQFYSIDDVKNDIENIISKSSRK